MINVAVTDRSEIGSKVGQTKKKLERKHDLCYLLAKLKDLGLFVLPSARQL